MKNPELYIKYKTNYPPLASSFFSKRNWWRIALITIVAVLIEPFMIHKNQRSVPFTLDYYLRMIKYFAIIVVPFVAFLFWINWRESIKRNRGYGWIGKFEVIDKQSTFAFCYLLLSPGHNNKLKVKRNLFEKIRTGDFIQIRRDVFGNIEEVSRLDSFSTRLARNIVKRFQKKKKPVQKQKL